ncbi:MAG TPA: zinc ABC transporter substrate-binding protein [Candidatus Krumholzibacteriaceae bacterium]|nr:zinc ABC transporter substrate-binding protein [Candidatus Krumholzibacteriaceae bacterium]
MRKMTYVIVAVLVLLIVIGTVLGLYLSNRLRPSSSTLKVLATFYPLYDFAQNVGGNKTDVSILVPETVDVHDFEPTPSSVAEVAGADVLIYNGAGLEPWISQIVSASENTKLIQVDTSHGIQLLQVSPEFQRNNQTFDPHIWLDPVLAKQQVNNILQGLIRADSADSQYFTQNAEAYKVKLDTLNSEAVNATTNVATRYFVTFHEAFAYFAKRYDLTQIPIAGPFQEEPTPSDIQNVIDATRQYHLLYVGYESLENPAISQSISRDTNATLILMNPIEGLTAQQKAAGKDYISLMQEDIANIGLALSHIGTS